MKSIAYFVEEKGYSISAIKRLVRKGTSVHHYLKDGEAMYFLFVLIDNDNDIKRFDIRDIESISDHNHWLYISNMERLDIVKDILQKPYNSVDLCDVPF